MPFVYADHVFMHVLRKLNNNLHESQFIEDCDPRLVDGDVNFRFQLFCTYEPHLRTKMGCFDSTLNRNVYPDCVYLYSLIFSAPIR